MAAGSMEEVMVSKKWLRHGTDAKVVARHCNLRVLVGQRVTLWFNLTLWLAIVTLWLNINLSRNLTSYDSSIIL